MNKKTKLVMDILKPKAKALGFNAAELKSVAEKISDTLNVDDEDDEDATKQAIETAVDAALPYLEMAQKNANRIIEDQRKKQKAQQQQQNQHQEDDDDEPIDDDAPAYVKALLKKMAAMETTIQGLSADKLSTSRKKQLEGIVKDAGSFGKRILKDFEGRTFDSADAFESWLEDVKTDCEAYSQEMADAGLKGMTGAGQKGNEGNSSKEISDKEVEALADTF